MEIYPSLISSDLLNLAQTIRQLDPHCHGYHIDVMDNHFVPNLTWGTAFVEAFTKVTTLPLHVHLMVDDPVAWVKKLSLRNQDIFIFHYEAMQTDETIEGLIAMVKAKNWRVGIAINPATHIETILDFLPRIDKALLMSVEPGFSGQKFIDSVAEKVPLLSAYKKKQSLPVKIGLDGGIGPHNIAALTQQGAQQFSIASAIFSSDDWVGAVKKLYH